MRNILFVLFVLMFSFVACGKPIIDKNEIEYQRSETESRPVIDYRLARTYLFGELHYGNGIITDVYCDQEYDAKDGVGRGKIPSPQALNCEHTWPQSKFESHPQKEVIKVDLHHLYPATTMANSTRSNHPFGEVKGKNVCGTSYLGYIFGTRMVGFQPPEHHRGNVARAMFYISARYSMPIDPVQESYLRKWHVLDPIDTFEQLRNKKIQQIQGNNNPFIDDPSLVNTVRDF